MNAQTNTAKIYVALDCLLDMRLGAMVLLDDEFAFEVSTQESYYLREEDYFVSKKYGALGKEMLSKLLRQRADDILPNSLKTRLPKFIFDLGKRLKDQAHNTPYHTDMAIEVNTYPCSLTQEELATLLRVIKECIGGDYPISLIHKSDELLTYRYVKDNYRCVVMYDYKNWMNLYDKEIKKSPLKETCFYVPKLYFGTPPAREALLELEKHRTDPFSFMEEIMMPLVPIQFLPIALFCADIPMNKDFYARI